MSYDVREETREEMERVLIRAGMPPPGQVLKREENRYHYGTMPRNIRRGH